MEGILEDCTEHDNLLKAVYKLIENVDSDVVIPMFASIACGAAAQDGVNRSFFTRYIMEAIADAYDMFTRDENEAVH